MTSKSSNGRQNCDHESVMANQTRVFISYSRHDKEFVDRLVEALAVEGNLQAFRDTDDYSSG